MSHQINLAEWYEPEEAARVLTRNSGRKVKSAYLRKLAEYGKVRALKISSRASLYYRPDVDRYVVEPRGRKSSKAQREKAAQRKVKQAESEEEQA